MKIAFQIDPLESLDPIKDSTLYLIREALKRGYEVLYYLTKDLYVNSGTVKAIAKRLTFSENKINEDSTQQSIDLSDIDVVMVRNDPPFNMEYLACTQMLDLLPESTLVVNNPNGLRNVSEKLFICGYPEFMAPTCVTQNIKVAEQFLIENKDIVLKPLYHFGGKDVIQIKALSDLNHFFPLLLKEYSAPVILQKFLPGVKDGDKRVMLIDGEAVAPFYRIPKTGEIRANTIHGSEVVKCSLTPTEEKACEIIGKAVVDKGIIFAGLDFIEGYITEVNVTSVGAIHYANKLYNLIGPSTIESRIWDCIENKLSSQR